MSSGVTRLANQAEDELRQIVSAIMKLQPGLAGQTRVYRAVGQAIWGPEFVTSSAATDAKKADTKVFNLDNLDDEDDNLDDENDNLDDEDDNLDDEDDNLDDEDDNLDDEDDNLDTPRMKRHLEADTTPPSTSKRARVILLPKEKPAPEKTDHEKKPGSKGKDTKKKPGSKEKGIKNKPDSKEKNTKKKPEPKETGLEKKPDSEEKEVKKPRGRRSTKLQRVTEA